MGELKYLELHGNRLAYQDEGQGDAILLLHGMAGSSQTWRSVIRPLSRKYRVIAPDLLGHGMSAKPRSDYSLGAFAVLLRDLLDELGVARATVVGHSLGGGVAMQFVYQHPDYCERLVLIGSGGLGPDVGWTLRLLSAPGAELGAGLELGSPPPVGSLPPSLGVFPLRHVDDYADRVPASWREKGGVFLPMYQREAMWIAFNGPSHQPRAVQVAVGKVCALTGLTMPAWRRARWKARARIASSK